MKLEWKKSWEDWGVVPELDVEYHRDVQGYDIYSDEDGEYLYLEDMDGNVGRFDAGDTPYEDFEGWLALAFSQIDIA